MFRFLAVALVMVSLLSAAEIGKFDYVLGSYGIFNTIRAYHGLWSITGDADSTELTSAGVLTITADEVIFGVDSGNVLTFNDPVTLDDQLTLLGRLAVGDDTTYGVYDTITVLGADTMPMDLIFQYGILMDVD